MILSSFIIFSSAYRLLRLLLTVSSIVFHRSSPLFCWSGSQGRVARHVLRAPPKTTRITSAATASTKAGAPKAPAAAPKHQRHQRHPKIEMKARDKAIQSVTKQSSTPKAFRKRKRKHEKQHIANTSANNFLLKLNRSLRRKTSELACNEILQEASFWKAGGSKGKQSQDTWSCQQIKFIKFFFTYPTFNLEMWDSYLAYLKLFDYFQDKQLQIANILPYSACEHQEGRGAIGQDLVIRRSSRLPQQVTICHHHCRPMSAVGGAGLYRSLSVSTRLSSRRFLPSSKDPAFQQMSAGRAPGTRCSTPRAGSQVWLCVAVLRVHCLPLSESYKSLTRFALWLLSTAKLFEWKYQVASSSTVSTLTPAFSAAESRRRSQ